jgi:GNAT superfamily N-acetyltransferase
MEKPMENMEFTEGLPTLADYCRLTREVGWETYKNLEVAQTSLDKSLFSIVARDLGNNSVVGTGRILGDGAMFFYVQDVMVSPPYQHKGIGTAIMDQLMGFLERNAPEKAYIGLFTVAHLARFYERYGFSGPEKHFYGMRVKKLGQNLHRKTSGS